MPIPEGEPRRGPCQVERACPCRDGLRGLRWELLRVGRGWVRNAHSAPKYGQEV